MAIASLVLGIVALILAIIPGFGLYGAIAGIIGIILGALGRKNVEHKGVATAGLVLSIVAVALGLIFWIACVACISAADAAINEAANELNDIIVEAQKFN